MKKNIILILIHILLVAISFQLNARYYNPTIGRFITADNVIPGGGADLQGLNRYSYCINNPIIYVDPTGHENEKSQKALNYTSNDINFFTSTFPTYSNNVYNWQSKQWKTQQFNLGHFILNDPDSKRFLGLMALTTGLAMGGVGFWPALLTEGGYIFGSRAVIDGKFDAETFKTGTIETATYWGGATTLYGGAKFAYRLYNPEIKIYGGKDFVISILDNEPTWIPRELSTEEMCSMQEYFNREVVQHQIISEFGTDYFLRVGSSSNRTSFTKSLDFDGLPYKLSVLGHSHPLNSSAKTSSEDIYFTWRACRDGLLDQKTSNIYFNNKTYPFEIRKPNDSEIYDLKSRGVKVNLE
jgi:RHS repeat-associated protein